MRGQPQQRKTVKGNTQKRTLNSQVENEAKHLSLATQSNSLKIDQEDCVEVD
jgi:hypothetical protein